MALTTNQRKALELARKRIANGDHTFLCFALNFVAGENERLAIACSELRTYVCHALEGHATLDDWIREKHGAKKAPRWINDRQQARIQWIDWMLGETLQQHQQQVSDSLTREARENPRILIGRPMTINSPRDRRPVRIALPSIDI
jgi:hypothetical protein